MKAIRETLGFAGLVVMGPLIFAGALAGLVAFLAALQAMAPFVFLGAMGCFLWQVLVRSPKDRENWRRQREEEQQRVHLLIQSHLAAHGMVDNHENRVAALDLLCRPAKRKGRS